MARYRISRPAQADLAGILAASEQRWGFEGKTRYEALLAAAMRAAAAYPGGVATRDRGDLATGMRSVHLRHAAREFPAARVRRPVRILYYRRVGPALIEIVRVLRERMDPIRHIGAGHRR